MNIAKINILIVYLMAITSYAKDIHYNCTGSNFYGNHLFADRFTDNMSDYIDQLKEVCILGHGSKTLPSAEYLRLASEKTPRDVYDFDTMRALMLGCLQEIETITGISKGDENLIGAIAQDIQNNVGLINIMSGIMFGDTQDVQLEN